MSFQAITDILVNTQTVEKQLTMSKTVNDSNDASTISFSDLVNSYKNDEKTEETKAQNIEKKENNSEKEVSINEDSKKIENENASAEVSTEKSDEVKNEESVKSEDKKKQPEKIKTDADNSTEDKKKIISKDKKIKNADNSKSVETQKGTVLSEKDFSRISEIEVEKNESLQNVNIKQVEENDKKTAKIETENNEEIIQVVQELQLNNQVVENQLQETDKEDLKLELDSNTDNSKKVTKLDSNGKIVVQDLRTEKVNAAEESKKTNLKVTEVKYSNDNSATITMELNQAQENVLSLDNQTAASNGSNFQSMLNNQIQANVPEFVKAGSIILKDNDQGTINLVLHPDDLGNVKIHLTMDGKSVSGHITVATKEALQVFKDNAETLREAFIKSGFDGANFEVSYGNGGSGSQNMNFEQRQDGSNLVANYVYNSGRGTDSIDSMLDNFIGNEQNFENFSINIVA